MSKIMSQLAVSENIFVHRHETHVQIGRVRIFGYTVEEIVDPETMISLDQLNIESDADEGFVDITAEIFGSLDHITDNKVVSSHLFQLLEGTRAVEVLNKQLDTGLITLSEKELQFNTADPQSVQSVISIQNRLLRLLPSWLNNSSLPVTVLSCRYVQTILENFAYYQDGSLSQRCSLVDRRLALDDRKQPIEDSVEYQLVHKVLKAFIIGLCKFIRFSLNVATTVLYEEEDVTTRTMSLDFLTEVPSMAAIDEINHTIEWILASNIEEGADVLIAQLKLIQSLNHLEVVVHMEVPLFHDSQGSTYKKRPAFLNFLVDGLGQIEKLSALSYTYPTPEGAFSKFIQLDRENKTIPYEIYEIDQKDAWASLHNLFESVDKFTTQAHNVVNFNQLSNFLKFDIGQSMSGSNVIARGIFQLYLIRDDRRILGAQTVSLGDFCIESIENISGANTNILSFDDLQLSNVKPEIRDALKGKFQNLMMDLESCLFHNLTIYGSNPCRQQQLISKNLLLWDTLQAAWESFEVECFQLCNIGDEMPSGDLSMSVSSYIYFSKLSQMLEYALTGISLDIYKDYELYMIYWYSSYIIQMICEHAAGRMAEVINGKINYIEKSHPKKIKKVKAGPKKEQLKQLQQYYQSDVLPQLIQTKNYNQLYRVNSLVAMSGFLDAVGVYLVMLSSFGIMDFRKGPSNSLTTMENIYKVRMKPFSSIGVPSVPTYEQYEASFGHLGLDTSPSKYLQTKGLIGIVQERLQASKTQFKQLINDIKENENINSQFILNEHATIIKWYDDIVKSLISYSLEFANLSKILEEHKDDLSQINTQHYKVKITKGYHKYFPRISIEKLST
ncbi:glucose-repressible protein [Scheffersomyces xylosifermentans]|uniref:glucose-repressible protein n=1 Tax=Scheffersomyces xylosifermentans TaxID=1304137 RepID=UPI00315C8573